MPNTQQPPRAKKVEHITEMHGHTLIDNYYWLKDQSISNPEVLEQISAENSYADAVLAKSKPLQEKIYQEMLDRDKVDTEPVNDDEPKSEPEIEYTQIGEWYYWNAKKNKGDYFNTRYRKKAEPGTEEEILDLNEVVKNYEFIDVSRIEYTEDRKYLLISCQVKIEAPITWVFDVSNKVVITTLNSNDSYHLLNSKSLLYVSYDDHGDKKVCCIKKHLFNTLPETDEILYSQTDSSFYLLVNFQMSESGRFLIFKNYKSDSCEWWYLDVEQSTLEFKCFSPMEKSVNYRIFHCGDFFYIVTNCDGAENYKIMRTPVDMTEKENWLEVVAHQKDKYLAARRGDASTSCLKDYFAYLEYSGTDTVIKYINNQTLEIKTIDFKTNQPFDFKDFDQDYDSDSIFFSVCSFNMAVHSYEFIISDEKLELNEKQQISGYDPEFYNCERVWVKASDGVEIPVSLFYRKDLMKMDGTNPLLIEGYGAYGSRSYEYFNADNLSVVDRGFVYAFAHIRGGGCLGPKWYKSGIKANKIRCFEDFVDCTKWLRNSKYADKDKIVALGGSAGAHVMGYLVNNHPDLFHCVVATATGTDDLNAFLADDNPHVMGSEVAEYGDINNKSDFENILSITPYYNIKQQNYPHILAGTGLYDDNVRFWEPLKWIQKIREYKTDDNQQFVLNGNHRHYIDLESISKIMAYICDLFGIKE